MGCTLHKRIHLLKLKREIYYAVLYVSTVQFWSFPKCVCLKYDGGNESGVAARAALAVDHIGSGLAVGHNGL